MIMLIRVMFYFSNEIVLIDNNSKRSPLFFLNYIYRGGLGMKFSLREIRNLA